MIKFKKYHQFRYFEFNFTKVFIAITTIIIVIKFSKNLRVNFVILIKFIAMGYRWNLHWDSKFIGFRLTAIFTVKFIKDCLDLNFIVINLVNFMKITEFTKNFVSFIIIKVTMDYQKNYWFLNFIFDFFINFIITNLQFAIVIIIKVNFKSSVIELIVINFHSKYFENFLNSAYFACLLNSIDIVINYFHCYSNFKNSVINFIIKFTIVDFRNSIKNFRNLKNYYYLLGFN